MLKCMIQNFLFFLMEATFPTILIGIVDIAVYFFLDQKPKPKAKMDATKPTMEQMFSIHL
jgi:hypothetical protein